MQQVRTTSMTRYPFKRCWKFKTVTKWSHPFPNRLNQICMLNMVSAKFSESLHEYIHIPNSNRCNEKLKIEKNREVKLERNECNNKKFQ